MKESLKKYETFISISLIVIYIILNSFCIQNFGLTSYKSIIINLLLSLIIVVFIIKHKLTKYYGLCIFPSPKKYLYFIPLLILVSVNLWNGININYTIIEICFYVINMLIIGFLEEIIFRGFLFKMMEKDNLKGAIIISSFTFGIGHIINLLNGAELFSTLIQICYAISIGYLFVIIFVKSGSLWPSIICHSLVNALSTFNTEGIITTYISPIVLIIIPILYSIYIVKNIK